MTGYRVDGMSPFQGAEMNDIVGLLNNISDPQMRRGVAQMLSQTANGTGQVANAQRLQTVADGIATHQGKNGVNFSLKDQPVGSTTMTSPPHAGYSQKSAAGYSVPLKDIK